MSGPEVITDSGPESGGGPVRTVRVGAQLAGQEGGLTGQPGPQNWVKTALKKRHNG